MSYFYGKTRNLNKKLSLPCGLLSALLCTVYLYTDQTSRISKNTCLRAAFS